MSKEVTAQLREKMEEELGATVILDTLDLKVTSVKGSEWVLKGVATAHLTKEGVIIAYDVRAVFVQGSWPDGVGLYREEGLGPVRRFRKENVGRPAAQLRENGGSPRGRPLSTLVRVFAGDGPAHFAVRL